MNQVHSLPHTYHTYTRFYTISFVNPGYLDYVDKGKVFTVVAVSTIGQLLKQ